MIQKKYRVLVVDDHPIVRAGVIRMIASEPEFEVCGEADRWETALSESAERKPDAVVLDISLGNRIGLDLIREITDLLPSVRILILSMHDQALYAERALRAGAHGYVMKSSATDCVIQGLGVILRGGIYAEGLRSDSNAGRDVGRNPVDVLSNREIEVLSMIGKGLSTDAIAARMHLSPKTVEVHRGNIRSKLGLDAGQRLVEVAIRYFPAGE
jgi:DNA-binding NarL/FixJ family response regulator